MDWKPSAWLAAILSLVLPPLGLIYVQRLRLAFAYFAAYIGLVFILCLGLWVLFDGPAIALLGWSGPAFGVICALHSWRAGRRTSLPFTQRRWYSRWYGLTCFPVAYFAVVFATAAFVFEIFRVPARSMYPTIPPGSTVIVKKLGYGNYGAFGFQVTRRPGRQKISRGDIVVYRSELDRRESYVHRVVAVPGDHVQYAGRQLALNGKRLPMELAGYDELYALATEQLDGQKITLAFIPGAPPRGSYELVVPPGNFVVFGDNRDNSRDSRYLGPISHDQIVGRVVYVVRSKRPP